MNAATEDRQIKSNLVVIQNTLIIDLNQNFIFADREIHVYLIRENFVGVKCQIFLKISSQQKFSLRKFSLSTLFIFADWRTDKFWQDEFLWICWKPRSPRKLIYSKFNPAKAYLLKIDIIHDILTAT